MLKLKNNGLEEQTVRIAGYYLNHLVSNINLDNPEDVKTFIANKNVDNGFKGNLVKAYNYHALINNIVWDVRITSGSKISRRFHLKKL